MDLKMTRTNKVIVKEQNKFQWTLGLELEMKNICAWRVHLNSVVEPEENINSLRCIHQINLHLLVINVRIRTCETLRRYCQTCYNCWHIKIPINLVNIYLEYVKEMFVWIVCKWCCKWQTLKRFNWKILCWPCENILYINSSCYSILLLLTLIL